MKLHAIKLVLLFAWCLLPLSLTADDVKVTVEIDDVDRLRAKTPIKGVITILHEEASKVDIGSFSIDGKPLKVEFVKDVKLSSDSSAILSSYRFTLEGKSKGIYLLPKILVHVGDNDFITVPFTYTVSNDPSAVKQNSGNPSTPTVGSSSTDYLELKASVEGSKTLYLGQRAKLIYVYSFVGNIHLSEEQLPMLDAKGLKKIGDTEIKDYESNGIGHHVVSQEVEATTPGVYTYGPSYITGFSSYQDPSGKLFYSKKLLRADADAMTITVKAIPLDGRPLSFTGAIGSYTFKVELASPPVASSGEKISLKISVAGNGALDDLKLPDLCCQPGWSGVFKQSDLPPSGFVHGDTKTFIVDVRPLAPSITEIPPIEFSYFDPVAEKFVTLKSAAVPLKVNVPKKSEKESSPKLPEPAIKAKEPAPIISKPPLIEISGNMPLEPKDLHNVIFGTWWSLLAFPIGAAVIIFQVNLRRYLKVQAAKIKLKNGDEWFADALKETECTPAFYHALYRAFFYRLVEIGAIASTNITPEALPTTGISGKVREFLCSLEEKRYAGKDIPSKKAIVEEARNLFMKIGNKP